MILRAYGKGVLLACFLFFSTSCEPLDDLIDVNKPEELDPEDVIALSFIPDTAGTLFADTLPLRIIAGIEADRGKDVLFATTRGHFVGSDGKTEIMVKADSVRPDDDSVFAAVHLNVGRVPGPTRISVTVGEFTLKTPDIELETAYADSMRVDASRLLIETDGSVTLTARLARNQGAVSAGIRVRFEATLHPPDTLPVGRFLISEEGVSDTLGHVVRQYFADTGNVTAGDSIRISVTVEQPTAVEQPTEIVKTLFLRAL